MQSKQWSLGQPMLSGKYTHHATHYTVHCAPRATHRAPRTTCHCVWRYTVCATAHLVLRRVVFDGLCVRLPRMTGSVMDFFDNGASCVRAPSACDTVVHFTRHGLPPHLRTMLVVRAVHCLSVLTSLRDGTCAHGPFVCRLCTAAGRGGVGVCAIANKMYAAGGRDDDQLLCTAEVHAVSHFLWHHFEKGERCY